MWLSKTCALKSTLNVLVIEAFKKRLILFIFLTIFSNSEKYFDLDFKKGFVHPFGSEIFVLLT